MQSPTIGHSHGHASGRGPDDPGVPWKVVTTIALTQGRKFRALRRLDPEGGPLTALVRPPSQCPKPEGIELPRAVVPEFNRGLAVLVLTPFGHLVAGDT